ncbi:MAG: hypothetical protein ACREVG_09350, partial [Burkholderiales bacterium]
SPERLRGPGCGWAQCGYAVVVSTPASFKGRIRCILFMGKRARIFHHRESKVKPRVSSRHMPAIIGLAGSVRRGVANAGSVFDQDGGLVDDQVRKQVAAFMAGFAEFVLD